MTVIQSSRYNIIVFVSVLLSLPFLFSGCRHAKLYKVRVRTFTDEVRLKTTPVKSQRNNELCWTYAMLATIETEHLMQGDSVNLSPLFTARHFLEEQALRRYMTGNGRQPITLRGMGSMALHHLSRYGAMSYDACRMPDKVEWKQLFRRLEILVDAHRAHNNGIEALRRDVGRVLDDVLGPVPRFVFMYGCEYTPLEFAHSVCRNGEYQALTSFSHHPYYWEVPLEVADNYYCDAFYNVPVDELMARIDMALDSGHPVCWEGDISEPLFDFKAGVAEMSDEVRTYSQADRQKAFETKATTDDHCMAIIGRAHNSSGRRYYICKNSWGKNNPYGGMMYLSENYIRMKTVAVFMPYIDYQPNASKRQ